MTLSFITYNPDWKTLFNTSGNMFTLTEALYGGALPQKVVIVRANDRLTLASPSAYWSIVRNSAPFRYIVANVFVDC